MLGAFADLPNLTPADSLTTLESQIGRRLRIDNHYYDWTDGFPGPRDTADVAVGRIPMITWWGTKYASINNGSQDGLIRARAQQVKSFGKPLFIRWAAEMNGDWFAWGGPQNNNDTSGFISAWRRIHDIFAAQGVNNVAWVWAPNADSKPGGIDPTSWNNWRKYYPGDAYVDWVGIDGYNWGSSQSWSSWTSLASLIAPVYADYAARKPIMVAETASAEQGGDKSAWLDAARDVLKTRFQHVAALVYFDQDKETNWSVTSSPAALRSFRALARDPYFAPRGPRLLASAAQPPVRPGLGRRGPFFGIE
jgi:hypothetical protein